MPDRPEPQEITDVAALKLLAHPMRQRIERLLRDGPANATTLARALGQSTGVTSYHLRQMAEHGFVEEVPELAKGRERWWRHVPADRRIPPYSAQSPEMRTAVEEMNRLDLADDLEQFARFQVARAELGEWADALAWSRSAMRLTVAELAEFLEEYVKLLYRYKRPEEDTPPEARTVVARLLAFPTTDDDQ
ncbi:ArsR family transcriptional regulator [Spongiactinospora rosea]|uniref:ArsR family transcriptional regulator n=1 Tax=Spongiactinospora rosea TaxID=2248750 RepID=A0A366LX94_9ACTN|nr:helix-turn-helix domain-containing protein [Spongiactinospora rosea]RBQ17934.1 ArsR family transcriptional regulator [Spongiactinospora rosea]